MTESAYSWRASPRGSGLLQQRLDFAVFPAVLHGDGARVGRNGVAPTVAAPGAAAAARGRALSTAFEPVDEVVFQLEFVECDLVGVLADRVETCLLYTSPSPRD